MSRKGPVRICIQPELILVVANNNNKVTAKLEDGHGYKYCIAIPDTINISTEQLYGNMSVTSLRSEQ